MYTHIHAHTCAQYALLEEKFGLAKHCMDVYERISCAAQQEACIQIYTHTHTHTHVCTVRTARGEVWPGQTLHGNVQAHVVRRTTRISHTNIHTHTHTPTHPHTYAHMCAQYALLEVKLGLARHCMEVYERMSCAAQREFCIQIYTHSYTHTHTHTHTHVCTVCTA